MFIYKKLFNFPFIFFQAEGSSTGSTDGGGSVNHGTTPNGEEKSQQSQTSTENIEGQGSEDKTDEKTVPYTRFSELNKKQKELQTQLDNLLEEKKKTEKAKEKAEREAKEKAGEFENLYTDTKNKYEVLEAENATSKTRIEVLEGVVQELLEAELKEIDKEHQELIPENLTVEQKLSWISKAKSKGLFGAKKEEISIGGPANPSTPTKKISEMSPNELFKMAFSKK